jgi:hypothetical protein
MSDFFDRLEHELRGAVARAAPAETDPAEHRSARGRPARPTVAGLIIAIGSVAAIAILVLAVALTGHGRHVQASSPPRPTGAPTGAVCTRRLLSAVAVLRRPQTRADRAFNPQGIRITGVSQSKPFPYVVVPGLTRRARTLPNGRPVFFVVYRPTGDTLLTELGDLLQVVVPSPGGRSAAFVTQVMAPMLPSDYRQPPLRIADVYLGLVPNGVARVTWTFPREAVPRITVPGGPVLKAHVIPGAQITATVHGNVAAANSPRQRVFLPSIATWLAADGHVIKTVKYYVPTLPHGISTTSKSNGIVTSSSFAGAPIQASC